MFSFLIGIVFFSAGILGTIAGPVAPRQSSGTFVTDITQCSALTPRNPPPASVNDLRPDDFSVVMAIGDSGTAALFAKGIQDNALLDFVEWRGVSYAAGGDPGAITIPNLLQFYNSTLQGASLGNNPGIEFCNGLDCPIGPVGWNPPVDQLNAALSGAVASNLMHEVQDYLVPQVQARNIPANAFKYLNMQIGTNDICQLCTTGVFPGGLGNPDSYEAYVREALQYVQAHIPNVLVNLVGVEEVSLLYELTLNQPYCQQLVPALPHENIECPCMLLAGPEGAATRAEMNLLQSEYNSRLLSIVQDYQTMADPTFNVIWQPANSTLSNYPLTALSNIDCLHPSTSAHANLAAALWNRLTLDATSRAAPIPFEDTLTFRCLEDDDRIQTSANV